MADAFGHLKRLWLVLACALLVQASAAGQPANAGRPGVRFTVFAAKPMPALGFIPRPGAPLQTIAFQPTSRSVRQEYRGTMPLRFIDPSSGAIVAEAAIPPDMRDALLLFTPIERAATEKTKGALRYQVAVLDDGAGRHAAGGLAIVNLSGLSLSGTVNNKENVTLKAGLNPTLAVGRSAAIVLRTTFNKRSYQSFATKTTLTAKQRALLILFPPFNKGSLEVQSRLLIDEPPAAAVAR